MLSAPPASGRVIVCEDDAPTLDLLCDHLRAERFDPLPAGDAAEAMRLCQLNDPALLLLDLNLPDASGFDVLREIRASDPAAGGCDPELPVIVISGRGSAADRVRGLECGADDYVLKPFAIAEVVARMRAVLRRRDRRSGGPLRVGSLSVDPNRRRVCVGGREIRLSGKEFGLVSVLASDPTRVFTKAELLRDVWGYRSADRTRTLDSHASRLRRKLDPEAGRFVKNVWAIGYRLIDEHSDGNAELTR